MNIYKDLAKAVGLILFKGLLDQIFDDDKSKGGHKGSKRSNGRKRRK